MKKLSLNIGLGSLVVVGSLAPLLVTSCKSKSSGLKSITINTIDIDEFQQDSETFYAYGHDFFGIGEVTGLLFPNEINVIDWVGPLGQTEDDGDKYGYVFLGRSKETINQYVDEFAIDADFSPSQVSKLKNGDEIEVPLDDEGNIGYFECMILTNFDEVYNFIGGGSETVTYI